MEFYELWELSWEQTPHERWGQQCSPTSDCFSCPCLQFQDDAETVSRSLKKMSSDLDTKYTKFNKDSPGVVSDLLLHLEVRSLGLVEPSRLKEIAHLWHKNAIASSLQ